MSLRLTRYRSLPAGQQGPGSLAPRTDGTLVAALPANNVRGPWMKPAGHDWTDALNVPGTFAMNSGDMPRRWTNDRFMATPRRVAKQAERYAMAFFSPRTTIPSSRRCQPCANGQQSPRHEPITAGKWRGGSWRASAAQGHRVVRIADAPLALVTGGASMIGDATAARHLRDVLDVSGAFTLHLIGSTGPHRPVLPLSESERTSAMGSLQDRVAIVTGGAQGIGKATVERFAAEGAKIVAADIDEDALATTVGAVAKSGARCVGVVGDTTEMSTAQQLAEAALREFGRIDILVNNVGGGSPGRIWEMTEEHWDRVLRLNTRSMFVCTRAVVNQMMRQRYGRIVNISSGSRDGSRWLAAYSGAAPYSTGKAGVYGFTREISLELAEYGITVNSVSPGPIATERILSYGFVHDDSLPLGPLRLTPLRRFGEPHEVAAAITFVASDEASYITGEIIDVNGGGGR